MLTERVWDPGNQNGKELTEDLEYPGSLSHPTVPHTVSLPDKRDDTAIAMYTELEFILGMDDILEDKENSLPTQPASFIHTVPRRSLSNRVSWVCVAPRVPADKQKIYECSPALAFQFNSPADLTKFLVFTFSKFL